MKDYIETKAAILATSDIRLKDDYSNEIDSSKTIQDYITFLAEATTSGILYGIYNTNIIACWREDLQGNNFLINAMNSSMNILNSLKSRKFGIMPITITLFVGDIIWINSPRINIIGDFVKSAINIANQVSWYDSDCIITNFSNIDYLFFNFHFEKIEELNNQGSFYKINTDFREQAFA